MAWPRMGQASSSAATGSTFMMGELPTTPSFGSSVNITVKPVPYSKVSAARPHQPAGAVGQCRPVCVLAKAKVSTATMPMLSAERNRPSSTATSCWVSTRMSPKVAAATVAKAAPAPMRAHCPCAPRPEVAPATSSASARPNRITGMATSTARSGRCRYNAQAQKAAHSG